MELKSSGKFSPDRSVKSFSLRRKEIQSGNYKPCTTNTSLYEENADFQNVLKKRARALHEQTGE